jgi:hypothetical protein
MSLPSYIKTNQDELFDASSSEIQELIYGGEIEAAVITLAANYNITVGAQTALSNIISFILIGALAPEDVLEALQEILSIDSETAFKITTDLEHSILEKARISLFTEKDGEVKTLLFQGKRSKEELRKEILDTTKRESGIEKNQSTTIKPAVKKPSIITPGSRSQLLEQLQILGTIPNDEEIVERLSHIQKQISAIKEQEADNVLDSNIALKSFMFGEKGKEAVVPTSRPATYSTAPTAYNVDPYRESSEA